VTAVAFDTLKLARRLEGAGFTRDQATGAAEALAETFSGELATKADIGELRATTKAELTEMRAGLRAEITGVKTDIAELRSDLRGEIANLRTETARWIIGAVFINIVTVIAAVAAVWQLAHR
jgi:hypothetical protein